MHSGTECNMYNILNIGSQDVSLSLNERLIDEDNKDNKDNDTMLNDDDPFESDTVTDFENSMYHQQVKTMKKGFLITHLNTRSLRGKRDQIKLLLFHQSFDLFAMTETVVRSFN